MKIEWAPLNVPLRRRLQIFTVAGYEIIALSYILASYIAMLLILVSLCSQKRAIFDSYQQQHPINFNQELSTIFNNNNHHAFMPIRNTP